MGKRYSKDSVWGCCSVSAATLTLCLLSMLWLSPAQAAQTLSTFDQADWTVTAANSRPDEASEWQRVDLPDSHAVLRHEGRYLGDRPHGFDAPWHWYRLRLDDALFDGSDLGVFIPRYADRIRMYFNGERVARSFRAPTRVELGWNRPFHGVLPARLQRAHGNTLMLALDSPYLGRVQLARPRIGADETVNSLFESSYLMRIRSAEIAAGVLSVIALFGFAIWLAQPADTKHLLLGLAAASFAVRQAHFFVVVPWGSPPLFWWLAVISMAWAMCLILLFALRYYDHPRGWMETSLVGAALAISLVTVPGYGVDAYAYAGLIYIALAPIAVIAGVILLRRAVREPGLPQLLLAGGYLINLVLNLNDLAIQQRWISIERPFLGPIGAVLMCGSFIIALTTRYSQSLGEVAALNEKLEARVRERQLELERTHQRLSVALADQVRAEERQRLMREIHDGIGAQLTTALAAAEHGGRSDEQAVRALRSAIADLKLTVDSLEPVDGDLPSLLGNLRYRLTPQFRHAGLDVNWAVTPLPALAWLQPPHALHILRLLQEALSNMIQHAHAHRVSVETGVSQDPDGIWVDIRDDGCGFDPTMASQGRGLANMQARASALGGQLSLNSQPGRGTSVRLWLPLLQDARPTANRRAG